MNLALLLPQRQHIHLFFATSCDELRRVDRFTDLDQLFAAVCKLPPPIAGTAAIGHQLADEIAFLFDRVCDLVVIPEVWFDHIPPHRLTRRARFAAHLLAAHLADPIDWRFGYDEDPPPWDNLDDFHHTGDLEDDIPF
jgi:hypothetical protein